LVDGLVDDYMHDVADVRVNVSIHARKDDLIDDFDSQHGRDLNDDLVDDLLT
jgi:hypothetical protein